MSDPGGLENLVKDISPELWPQIYPKRIIPPLGYHNPKTFSAIAGYREVMARDFLKSHEDGKEVNEGDLYLAKQCHSIMDILIAHEFPTYFLDPTFCVSVSETAAPDFSFREINWPLRAFVLQLPKSFSNEFFGVEVHSLAVCRSDEDFMIWYSFPFRNGYGNEIRRENLDVTFDEFVRAVPAEDRDTLDHMKILGPHFVVNLLAILNARPNFIGPAETLQRPARGVPGEKKHRDALWNPRFIGSGYQPPTDGLEGTHRSPREHWRRGHFRRQRIGPGRMEFSIIWIEPTLVNGDVEVLNVDN